MTIFARLTRYPLLLVLGVISLFLFLTLLLVFFQSVDPVTRLAAYAQDATIMTMPEQSDGAVVRPSDVTSFTERPIFHRNRQKYVAPAAPAPQPVQPVVVRRNFQLAGILQNKRGERWAYVKDMDSREVKRLAAGDAFDDWRVEEIEEDRVTLRQGGNRLVLELDNGGQRDAGNAQNQQSGNGPVRTRRSRQN